MKDTVMKILKYILLIAVTVLFLFPVIYMLACSFMTGSQVSEMLNFSDGKYKELNMIPNMATLVAVLSDSFQKTRVFVKVLEFGCLYFPDSNRSGCSIIISGFCFCKIEIPVQGQAVFYIHNFAHSAVAGNSCA